MEGSLRTYLTKLREEAFLEVKSDWVDTRRGAWQGYILGRSGAVEA